jgi:hypothetical protein
MDRSFKADVSFGEPLRCGRGLVDGVDFGSEYNAWAFQVASALKAAQEEVKSAMKLAHSVANMGMIAGPMGVGLEHTMKKKYADEEPPPSPMADPSDKQSEESDGATTEPKAAIEFCALDTSGVEDNKGEDDEHTEPKAAIQICALDTPGVEDNKGEDDEHIEKVIEMVLELESLSGLAMVTKCGHPITPAWKSQVLRYYQLFPMMKAQWVFIHTNADPCALNSPSRRKTSSFEEHAIRRRKLVDEAMLDLTGDPHFGAAHIFIESDVQPMQLVGEGLKSYMAQQHNTLYTLIANFSPVRISNLPFCKGPKLLAIDSALVSALDASINAITATLSEYKKDIAELVKLRNNHQKERESLEKKVSDMGFEIARYDHEGFEDVVMHVNQERRFWNFARDTKTVIAKHADFQVAITDISGYEKFYLVEEREKRQTQPLPDGAVALTITVCVRWIWTKLKGKIVVRSPSRLVHATTIAKKKGLLAAASAELAQVKERQQEKEKELLCKEHKESETLRRHNTAMAVKTFLNAAWSVKVWRAMKPFYHQCTPSTDSTTLMNTFMTTWLTWRAATKQEPLGFEPVQNLSGALLEPMTR